MAVDLSAESHRRVMETFQRLVDDPNLPEESKTLYRQELAKSRASLAAELRNPSDNEARFKAATAAAEDPLDARLQSYQLQQRLGAFNETQKPTTPAPAPKQPQRGVADTLGFMLEPERQFILGAGAGATAGATNYLPGQVSPQTPIEKAGRQIGELAGSLLPFKYVAGGIAAVTSKLAWLKASPRISSAIQFGLANGVLDVLHIDSRSLSERFDPAALGFSIGAGGFQGAVAVPGAKGALLRAEKGKLPFYSRGELAFRMGGAAFLSGRLPQLAGQPVQQSPVSPTGAPWIDDFLWDMGTAAAVLPGQMKIGNKIPIVAFKGAEIIPTEAQIVSIEKSQGRQAYRLVLPNGEQTTYVPGSRILLGSAPPPIPTAQLRATAGGKIAVNDGDLVSVPTGKGFAVGRFRGTSIDSNKQPWWLVDLLPHVGATKGVTVFLNAGKSDLRLLDQQKGKDWSRMNPPPAGQEPEPVGPQPPPVVAPPAAERRMVQNAPARTIIDEIKQNIEQSPTYEPPPDIMARPEIGAFYERVRQLRSQVSMSAQIAEELKGTKLQAERGEEIRNVGGMPIRVPAAGTGVEDTTSIPGITIRAHTPEHAKTAAGYVRAILDALPPDMRRLMVQKVIVFDDPSDFNRTSAWYSPKTSEIGLNIAKPVPAKLSLFNKENLGLLNLPAPDQFVSSLAHEFSHRLQDLGPHGNVNAAYRALGWEPMPQAWTQDAIPIAPNRVLKNDVPYDISEGWVREISKRRVDVASIQHGPNEELARAVQSYVLNPELMSRNAPDAYNAVRFLLAGTPFEVRGATTTLEGQRLLFTTKETGSAGRVPVSMTPPPKEAPATAPFKPPIVTQELVLSADKGNPETIRHTIRKTPVRGASRFTSRPTANNPTAPWVFEGYHGTDLSRPPEQAPGEHPFQVHVGTPLAALQRIRAKSGQMANVAVDIKGLESAPRQRVYPARVTLHNPLGTPELPVADHGFETTWQAIQRFAKSKGHDGIIYHNLSEDPGSLSVIAFDSGQLDYRGQPTLPGVAQNLGNPPGAGVSEIGAKLSAEGPTRQERINAALSTIFADKKLAAEWQKAIDIANSDKLRAFGKNIDFEAAAPFLEDEATLYVLEKGTASGVLARLQSRIANLISQHGITAPVSTSEPAVAAAADKAIESGTQPEAPPKIPRLRSNVVSDYYAKLRGVNPAQIAADISALPPKAQDFARSLLGVNANGQLAGNPIPWAEAAKSAGYDNPGSVMRDVKIEKGGQLVPYPRKAEVPLSNDRLLFKWKQLKKMSLDASRPDLEALGKKVSDVEAEMNRRGISLEMPAPPPRGERPPGEPPKPQPPTGTFTPGDYILEPMIPSAVEFSKSVNEQRLKPLNFVLKRKVDGAVLGTYVGKQVRPDLRAQTRYDVAFAGWFGPKGERSATAKKGYHTRFLVTDLLNAGTEVGYFTPRGVQKIMNMDYHPGAGFDPTSGQLQPAAADIAAAIRGGFSPPAVRAGTEALKREEFLNLSGPEQMAHLRALTYDNARSKEAAWSHYGALSGIVTGYPERADDLVRLADALRQKWGEPIAPRRLDILDAIKKARDFREQNAQLGLRELASYMSPELGGKGAAFKETREAKAFLDILNKLLLSPDVPVDEPGNFFTQGRLPVGSNITPAARTMLIFGHPIMADLYQKARLSETYMHGLADQWAVKYAAIAEKLPIRDLILIGRIAEGRFDPNEKVRIASKALLQEPGFTPLRGARQTVADLQAFFGNVPVKDLLLPEPSGMHYIKAQQLRVLLDEIATVGHLPPEKYLPNYLSHIFQRNPGGWLELPVDMNPGEEVFLRFFQPRTANAPDYEVNLTEIMDLYIRGVARKTAFDPLLKEFYNPEVMNTLPPAQRNYATRWLRYLIGEPDKLDNEMSIALKEFGITGPHGSMFRWLRRAALNSERPATDIARIIKGWQFIAKLGFNMNIVGTNVTQAPITIAARYGWGKYFQALKAATSDENVKQLFAATHLAEEISRDSLGYEAMRVKTLMERVLEISTRGFRNTETGNRASAFAAGFKVAKESGFDAPEHVMAGILEADLTQFNLGRSGRIPILRGQAASTIFQFAPYRVEMLKLIGSMLQRAVVSPGERYQNVKRLLWIGATLQAIGGVNATFGPLLKYLSWEDQPFAEAIYNLDKLSIDYQLGKLTTGEPFEFGYRINPIWLLGGKIAGPGVGMINDTFGMLFGYAGAPSAAQIALRNLPFGAQTERTFGEQLEPTTTRIFGPKQGKLHGGTDAFSHVFGPSPNPKPGEFRSR